MTSATGAWLSAFLFTQAVEVPIYLTALRRAPADVEAPFTGTAALAAAFSASLITHPIVWFLIPRIPASSYVEMALRAETFAVVVEGIYLYALGAMRLRPALLTSLIANAISVSLGLLSRSLFGWP
ncbi:Hypothetical protein A7982_00893 [Minicystis rosea]|nr:Hypothetical protein A7982_00893 [Minicystis rosea]